jgi:hypothetical protein
MWIIVFGTCGTRPIAQCGGDEEDVALFFFWHPETGRENLTPIDPSKFKWLYASEKV